MAYENYYDAKVSRKKKTVSLVVPYLGMIFMKKFIICLIFKPNGRNNILEVKIVRERRWI
ncbi:hypothetical protein JCM30204_11110 [Dysgonomonas termitidis]